jgi:hypothetical protein
MLSVDQCRQLLGDDGHLSDAEIARLRDDLYGMAEVTVGVWQQRSRSRTALVDAALYDGNTGDGDRGAAAPKK